MTRWMKGLLGLLVGVLLVAAASPYWVVSQMRSAAQAQDAAALSAFVNFPLLKDDLKSDLVSMMTAQAGYSGGVPSLSAMESAFALALVGPLVDALITPASVALMFQGEAPSLSGGDVDQPASDRGEMPSSDVTVQTGYTGLNTFDVTVTSPHVPDAPLRLTLARSGLFAWQLVALDIPSVPTE